MAREPYKTRKKAKAIGFFDQMPFEAMNTAPIELKPLYDRYELTDRSTKTIDLELFAKLAFLCPSMAELASFFNYTPDGFAKRVEREPELLEIINKGKDALKMSLRRTMIRLALNGDTAMIKLLAMQPDLLNMTGDKPDQSRGALSRADVKNALLGAWEAAQEINAKQDADKRTINQSLTQSLLPGA